ncbi:MAG: BatA domain-containing protein, partial [Pseudomonadota bacterium]|nr:BatA domain-containing protein [Pseudomonadota bacterium]
MAALSTLTFAVPWLLAGLAVLPLLFIFLRVQPPAPRVIAFPPIALLAGLVPERARAQRTPWWLILLRLLIAGLLIVSFAGPRLDSGRDLPGQGPLLLVVDNGWAAAADWPARQAEAMAAVTRAGLTGRPVWVMPTASPAPPGPLSPAAAATAVRALKPRSWATDRAAVIATRTRRMAPPAGSLWIYDGAGSGAAALAQATARFGPLVVRQAKRAPLVLDTPTEGPAGLNLSVRRP